MREVRPAVTVPIAQFAARLRDHQGVIAVHERALFEYLTLDWRPAFPENNLIAVEITRTVEGNAEVTPRVFGFEYNRAIAA